MKLLLLMLLTLAVSAAATLGQGSQNIIKQRAKDIRDQNNARQGVPAASPGTAPAPAAAAPAPPTPGQASVARLQTEFAAIKPGMEVTAALKQKLASTIASTVQGPSKPSTARTEALAGQLCDALAGVQLTAANRARLAQDLEGLLNPARYPQARPQAIVDDIQALFQSTGMVRSRASAIASAAKAVGDEVAK